jgi:hypothetical protein
VGAAECGGGRGWGVYQKERESYDYRRGKSGEEGKNTCGRVLQWRRKINHRKRSSLEREDKENSGKAKRNNNHFEKFLRRNGSFFSLEKG